MPIWSRTCFLAALALVLWGCGDNNIKKIPSIAANKITLSKDRTYGAEVIYSDSAKVKAKGYTPILDKVTPSQGAPYTEMPKGVKIYFLDENLQNKATITSDYAISKDGEKQTIFRKNVVVVTDNMTFTTEELVWDENKKLFTSPAGTITTKDGNVLNGTSFTAPQDFSSYNITLPSAEAYLKEGQIP